MRGEIAVKRPWMWGGLGIALGVGLVLVEAGPGRVRATEKPEAGRRPDATVETARALVMQLEGQLRSTEASLKEARGLLAGLEAAGPVRPPASKDVADPRGDDTKALEGAWRLVGMGGGETGDFRPAPYVQYKIMGAGHYLWISLDRETGAVLRIGGGAYTVKDGIYTARVEFSNSEDLRAIVGQEYQFTCKLEGDKWFHAGPMPNGSRVDDLWERIK